MKLAHRILIPALMVLGICAASAATAADITGAGATFPYPIYAKWAEAYKAKTGTGMNYQSIGSGGGIKQITAKTVDFGASDMPLKAAALEKDGLIQFPTVMGGVVPVVNIAGVKAGDMKLTGKVLADIYLGKITKWNDPAIVALNKDLKLPATDITAVNRSDGSGTTFIFTNYLSKVSPEWKTKVGSATSVSWPAPNGAGGKGNEGVASFVQRLKNSIGYVEYAYAKQNKLAYVLLQNREGHYRHTLRQGLPGCGRRRRLEARARLLRDPDRRAGQGQLAHHRRHLHTLSQEPGAPGKGQGSTQVLRLGVRKRRPTGARPGLHPHARRGRRADPRRMERPG